MTYKELVDRIMLFPEKLEQDVTIYDPVTDECRPIFSVFEYLPDICPHCSRSEGLGSLDENHLVIEVKI